ncbi:hypothetical protein [Sphingomonas oryzagri]|uniref:Peptidase n=1 Tax=Sphingomonas oryzagri TaxID=3042314 RepID=A0ABT6N783_9SPHN|nr:hypothetical protein [Sphingomonas oryzagri]MDH7640960.1 hypothetical protein [Sphingomonas oryzagri]
MRNALTAALLATATVVATPALAAPHSFDVDGQHYTYVAHRDAKGDVTLRGQAGGDDFNLRVHGDRVNGVVGVSQVSFQIPAHTVEQLADEVPADAAAAPATLAAN